MAAPSRSDRTPLGIVTVSYGSAGVLGAFLKSVAIATETPASLVIADNRPDETHGVAALARESGAEYLGLADNPGYGAAVNAAVRQLPPEIEWLLISNPDVVLGAGSIDALRRTGDSDPAIGAVGPATLTASGDLYPSARAVPSLRTGVGHALFSNIWVGNPWTRRYRNEFDRSRPRDAGWLSGACLLVRRSVFDEIGGFDEGYFMYFEDVDLGWRIGKAGFRNVFEPAAVVTHAGAHSTSDSATMVRAHHDSARRFIRRKYSHRLLWPVRVSLEAGLRVRSWVVTRGLDR